MTTPKACYNMHNFNIDLKVSPCAIGLLFVPLVLWSIRPRLVGPLISGPMQPCFIVLQSVGSILHWSYFSIHPISQSSRET